MTLTCFHPTHLICDQTMLARLARQCCQNVYPTDRDQPIKHTHTNKLEPNERLDRRKQQKKMRSEAPMSAGTARSLAQKKTKRPNTVMTILKEPIPGVFSVLQFLIDRQPNHAGAQTKDYICEFAIDYKNHGII